MKISLRKALFIALFFFSVPGLRGEEKGEKVSPAVKEYDLNIPFRDEASGIVFPGKTGEFVKRVVRLNANEFIGRAVHYSAAGGISADIYLYRAEEKKGETLPSLLQREYDSAKKLIFAMEREKKREDMPERPELFFREKSFSAPFPFRCSSFTFMAGEEKYDSILFMTVLERENRRHLVKIRFSCPSELGKEGEKMWESFRKEFLLLLAPGKK